MGDGNKKIIKNYEPFGDFGELIEQGFVFAGKTPSGANHYVGRPGTRWTDVNFITDPTSKTSQLFLMKDGKLVPTELKGLRPEEVLQMRNNLSIGTIEKAKKESFKPIEIPTVNIGIAKGMIIK